MFIFTIKKWFFDYWDNFFRFIFLNFGFILSLIVGFGLWQLLAFLPESLLSQGIWAIIVPSVLIVVPVNIFFGASAGMVNDIANYKQPGFKEFWEYLKASIGLSLIYSVISASLLILFLYSTTFYISVEMKQLGLLAFAFIFWAGFVWLVASQYFYALHYRLEKRFMKKLKKMFLIFFDNPMFSIGLFLFSLLIITISVPTLLMIPGMIAYQLLVAVGLKLRLYKYDYLEENPDANRKKIPWRALVQKDRERVGKRSFKTTIFPWKK